MSERTKDVISPDTTPHEHAYGDWDGRGALPGWRRYCQCGAFQSRMELPDDRSTKP